MARHLLNAGIPVQAALTTSPDDLSTDSKKNLEILLQYGGQVHELTTPEDLEIVSIKRYQVIIDALLGTGLKGSVRGFKKTIIDKINSLKLPIISLDIPSGLTSNGETIKGSIISAKATLCVALPKAGMLSSIECGKLFILNIGFPEELLNSTALKQEWVDNSLAASWQPTRHAAAHKGEMGRVIIIAGSKKYFGAALLAYQGASSGGAGLIQLLYPESAASNPSLNNPGLISQPVPDENCGFFTEASTKTVLKELQEADSVVLGPGIGRDKKTTAFVKTVISQIKVPLVLDADGLYHLSILLPDYKFTSSNKTILTPHPGELKRLLNVIPEAQTAEELSSLLDVTITAKNWQTTVYSADKRSWLITSGSAALATGGTGDVLAGLTAALCGRGLPTEQAAALAAFLHGSAGFQTGEEQGLDGLKPENLANKIPIISKMLKSSIPGAPGPGRDSIIYSKHKRSR